MWIRKRSLNILKKFPIKTQLLILAGFTGVIMFVIFYMMYFQVSKVITKNNIQYTNEMFFQIKQNISSNCDLLDRMLTGIAYNSVVQNFILDDNPSNKIANFKNVDSLLLNMQEMKGGISDFAILGDNGKEYYLKGKKQGTRNILDTLPERIINFYTKLETIDNFGQKTNCFFVASTIYSIRENLEGKRIGLAAIALDTSILGLETNQKFKSSVTKFYLLDRNNLVYSSNDLSMVGQHLTDISYLKNSETPMNFVKINGEKSIVLQEEIPEIGGRIISITPQKVLFSDLLWIRQLTILFFLIAIAILSIPFMLIINNISHPLKKVMTFISSLKSGNLKDFKKRIELEGYAEISTLASEFNSMLNEIDSLTHRLVGTSMKLYEAELETKQAELAYLKSQINPHFIYNTLETMRGSAIDEGAVKTAEMTGYLGQIFRYSVKGADIVTLHEELEIVKSYVQIQQIRFNNRFKVIYEFSEEAQQCIILKMILQPIVENAIFHGLETKLGEGHLWMGAGIDENSDMHIWIKDDGCGMDETIVGIINSGFSERKERIGNSAGIGIANVNNRIRLTYGDNYGIKIKSERGKGTEVIIKIPVRGDKNV